VENIEELVPPEDSQSDSSYLFFGESRLELRDDPFTFPDLSPPSAQQQESPYSTSIPPSSPYSQENPNLPPHTTAASQCTAKEQHQIEPELEEDGMANFPVNPRPFLVVGLVVDHVTGHITGWNRPARAHVALGGEPPREHEDFAIVSINPMSQEIGELRPTLNVVCDFLNDTQRVRITESHLSPLGLGLIRLRTVAQRDKLVRESPFNLGQNHVVTVVKHDEGINHRACAYTRVCWIMFLAFPLDYQKDLFIRAVLAPFGWLLEWYRDDNRSKILAQVLTLGPDRVPRSLIVSRGTLIGGMGRSWSVPVYILNGHFPDVFPTDEDPILLDGEPHPEHPPMVFGPNPQPAN
jgi:hypothetical protein